VQIALLIAIVIGVVIAVFSCYAMVAGGGYTPSNAGNYVEVDNTIRALDASIQEADASMEEMEKLAASIFEELEGKYQELLFLYGLIDDKKKEAAAMYAQKAAPEPAIVVAKSEAKKERILANSPNARKILDLRDQGLDVPQIAKKLSVGQGEVKLILELSK